jgi:chromosome segregation ATPase
MSDQWKARQQEADSPYADAYCYIAATGDRPDQLYSLETLEELASCAERDASIPAYADSPALSAWRHELRSAIEREERAEKVRAHNERVSSELARASRGEIICLSDLMASQEELITDEIKRESAEESGTDVRAELVNGCNVEACLRYAQERISALESERDRARRQADSLQARLTLAERERDSWISTAQVLDRELTSANERVERWRSHAKDLEREVNARAELTAQAQEIRRAEDRANARARSNARARRSGR